MRRATLWSEALDLNSISNGDPLFVRSALSEGRPGQFREWRYTIAPINP